MSLCGDLRFLMCCCSCTGDAVPSHTAPNTCKMRDITATPNSAWPFLERSHSQHWSTPWGLQGGALRSWIQPIFTGAAHTALWARQRKRQEHSPRHLLFLDFFSEGKFRTNETEKVMQIHWQANKLQERNSFLQSQVCTLLELHESSRGIDWHRNCQEKDSPGRINNQLEGSRKLGCTAASLEPHSQNCSTAQYCCKAVPFSYCLWRGSWWQFPGITWRMVTKAQIHSRIWVGTAIQADTCGEQVATGWFLQ